MRFRRTSGFTLIEVLIAVAALSLIAVGLAAIFGTVRRTIMGGTALSRLTAEANQIERQMREDFAAMDRGGFFVISHEYAYDGLDVQSTGELGTLNRPRRIDQMIFFRTGDFTSARPAVISGTNAHSNVAMVYYGHGQQRPVQVFPDPPALNPYRQPELNDDNGVGWARLGSPMGFGVPNPNRYAADWTLLRHVTLLTPPASGLTTLPDGSVLGLSAGEMEDNDLQVGLQPAVSHIFRALQVNVLNPDPLPFASIRMSASPPVGTRPLIASGLVDVATTSLDEIRAIVTTVGAQPNTIVDQATLGNALDGKFTAADLPFMHAWMDDAFPTLLPTIGNASSAVRMRCEPAPPDFFSAISDSNSALEQAYRAADQDVLSASNIAPNCTEFIVEWSFGVVDQTGDLIWHDRDHPYTGDPAYDLYEMPYRRENPTGGYYGQFQKRGVSPDLIHGPNPPPSPERLMSYFGYVDPTFTPSSSATSTIPWAWPKLVRVTIRLADPTDRRVEETFQFVFKTPGNPAP